MVPPSKALWDCYEQGPLFVALETIVAHFVSGRHHLNFIAQRAYRHEFLRCGAHYTKILYLTWFETLNLDILFCHSETYR